MLQLDKLQLDILHSRETPADTADGPCSRNVQSHPKSRPADAAIECYIYQQISVVDVRAGHH